MRRVALISFILVSTCWTQQPAQQQVTIDRYGRNIQVDGYLMEWHERDVDTCQGTVSFMWDVINTSIGLAGYIRYRYDDSCSKIGIQVYPQMGSMHRFRTMDVDTHSVEQFLYAVDKSGDNGDTTVIAEWLLPWEQVTLDPMGRYEIGLVSFNSCEDTAPPIILTGSNVADEGKIVTNKIIVQIIIILILFISFIVLKTRARKLYKKK